MAHTSWLQYLLTSTLIVAAPIAGSGRTSAQSASGCATLATERVDLPDGVSTSHTIGAVPLKAGERLRIRMIAVGSDVGSGSIALTDGGETDASLIAGTAPQEASFTVPYDGLYGLQFRVDGAAALTFEVQCETIAATLPPSATPQAFIDRRAGRLLSEDLPQTNLRRRGATPETIDQAVQRSTVLDDAGNPAQVSVATSIQSLAAAEGNNISKSKLDVWVEGSVSQFEQRFEENNVRYDADGYNGTLHVGADYLLKPGLMIGGLLQFEQYREDYEKLSAASDSHGVFFGPYASVRLAPDLFFDARAAWGSSDNETDLPDGTRLTFETERQLLRGQVSGNRNLLGFQFAPSVALSVVEDHFADPDSLAVGMAETAGSVFGRLGVGSALSYRLGLDDGGFVQPSAGLSTGWNLDGLDAFAADPHGFSNETGAKAEAGVVFGTADGISIQANGAIEGLGQEDYSAWSGRLSLTAPLN